MSSILRRDPKTVVPDLMTREAARVAQWIDALDLRLMDDSGDAVRGAAVALGVAAVATLAVGGLL